MEEAAAAAEACYDYCRCRYCLYFGKFSSAKKCGEDGDGKRSDWSGGAGDEREEDEEQWSAVERMIVR